MPVSSGRAAAVLAAATLWAAFGQSATPAHAVSFDCKAASSAVEKSICADPALSESDSTLAALYDQVLTRAVSPDAVRTDQRRWLTQERNTVSGTAALQAVYNARIAVLRGIAYGDPARDACIAVASDEIRARKGCRVVYAGRVANAPGPALAFQTQEFADTDIPGKVQVVHFVETGAVLGFLSAGVEYERPRTIQSPAGTVLYLLGDTGGSGNFPDDALYLFRDGAWVAIDIQTWIDDLSKRLPKGLSANKGIFPDWKTMTAATALWRDADANCCPSGGGANLTLRLDGNRVVLDRIELTKPARR